MSWLKNDQGDISKVHITAWRSAARAEGRTVAQSYKGTALQSKVKSRTPEVGCCALLCGAQVGSSKSLVNKLRSAPGSKFI